MNSEIESLMAEHAAAMAEDNTNETEVSDAEMANRLSKTIAKKFATKRDNSGKPSINKYFCTGCPKKNWAFVQFLVLRLGRDMFRCRK